MVRGFVSLAIALSLAGCGAAERSLRLKARDDFAVGQTEAAEKKLLHRELAENKLELVLSALDLGIIAHFSGKYEKSNAYLERAIERHRELYTDSIREQLLTGILNDTSASYVGSDYEISYAHELKVLNFLSLAQSESVSADEAPEIKHGGEIFFAAQKYAARTLSDTERRQYLSQARAQVLAWDSFLNGLREGYRGAPVFKDDLMAKVFGAYVHERIGGSADREIARVLLDDAEKVLIRSYGIFEAYNLKSKDYAAHYSEFESLGEAKVQELYYSPTAELTTVRDEIKSQKRHLKDDDHARFVVLETGLVPEKTEQQYIIGMQTLFNGIQDPGLRSAIEQIGFRVVLHLAPEIAGALFVGALFGAADQSGPNPPIHLSDAIDRSLGILIKLPSVKYRPAHYQAKVRWAMGAAEAKLAILNPYDEIAYQNIHTRANQVAFKTAIRVGVKYLVALVAAIRIYQSIDGPRFLKLLAATGSFMIAKKVIDATERADVRASNFLPNRVFGAELTIPPEARDLEFVIENLDGKAPAPVVRKFSLPASVQKGAGLLEFRALDIDFEKSPLP